MKLSNGLMVKQMMEAYQQKIPHLPVPLDGETAELRKKLITEEYHEVMDAINNNEPLRDLAKELCDLLVVTYGTLLALGVNPDYAFTLVHNSNMTKLGSDGRPVKNEYGKVVKSENYKPADMNKIYDATTSGIAYYNVVSPCVQ